MIVKLKVRSKKDTNPLHKIVVNGVRYGNFAVHREALEKNGCRYWNVSHVNSGLLVGWFWNIKHAADFAEWINEQKVDWRRIGSRKDVMRNPIPKHIRNEARERVWHEPLPRSVAYCRSEGWCRYDF